MPEEPLPPPALLAGFFLELLEETFLALLAAGCLAAAGLLPELLCISLRRFAEAGTLFSCCGRIVCLKCHVPGT